MRPRVPTLHLIGECRQRADACWISCDTCGLVVTGTDVNDLDTNWRAHRRSLGLKTRDWRPSGRGVVRPPAVRRTPVEHWARL